MAPGKKALRDWWSPGGTPVITLLSAILILSAHILFNINGGNQYWTEVLGLRPHEVHTYLTYAIVHKDVNHAKENALLLMILGPGVERMIGGKTFLLTTIVLVLMGAIASATMARDHWL